MSNLVNNGLCQTLIDILKHFYIALQVAGDNFGWVILGLSDFKWYSFFVLLLKT